MEFWNQKTFCLVTGASRGIGHKIAIEFSKKVGPGSVFLIVARSGKGLEETKGQMNLENCQVVVSEQDLGKPNAEEYGEMIRSAMTSTNTNISDFQHSILVHNAGSIGNPKLNLLQLDNLKEIQDYYTFNVFSLILLTNTFFKIFSDSSKQRSVVQISSRASIEAFPSLSSYCSGKAARDSIMRSLAVEEPSISTMCYSPGPIDTQMFTQVLEETGSPDLLKIFKGMKESGVVLTCEQTVEKLVGILGKKIFTKGEFVSYFDN